MHLVAQLSHQSVIDEQVLTAMATHSKSAKRVSAPPQHRKNVLLRKEQIDALVAQFQGGEAVQVLADRFGVHRTTVVNHLRGRGLWPRP